MGLLHPAGHTATHSVQSSAAAGREPRRAAVFAGQHPLGVFDVVSALNSYSSPVPLSVRHLLKGIRAKYVAFVYLFLF